MDNRDCILINNFEDLGKNFLKKAMNFAVKKEFQKSYEFLKEGLLYVTCDCQRGIWFEDFENNKNENLFNDIENYTSNHYEYFFVKSYVLSYSEDKIKLYSALESVEKCLKIEEEEESYLIKSRIHGELEEYEKANECILKASNLNNTSRSKYRLGRLREFQFNQYGIDNLFTSFIENPSSACCAEKLQQAFRKRELILNYKDQFESNPLIDSFENDNSFPFLLKYSLHFRKQLIEKEKINIVNSFIEIIKLNEGLFLIDDNNFFDLNEDDFDEQEDDNYSNYDSSEDYSFNDEYYNDNLDMDQQSPEFWDSL